MLLWYINDIYSLFMIDNEFFVVVVIFHSSTLHTYSVMFIFVEFQEDFFKQTKINVLMYRMNLSSFGSSHSAYRLVVIVFAEKKNNSFKLCSHICIESNRYGFSIIIMICHFSSSSQQFQIERMNYFIQTGHNVYAKQAYTANNQCQTTSFL